jgi:hypothetical protein
MPSSLNIARKTLRIICFVPTISGLELARDRSLPIVWRAAKG